VLLFAKSHPGFIAKASERPEVVASAWDPRRTHAKSSAAPDKVSLHHGNCKKLFFLLVTILKNAFRQTMSSCAKTTGAGGARDGGVEQGVEAGVEEAIATVGAARNSELDDIYPASDL